jgi:hypothetical protein
LLAHGWWFSPGILSSYTTKTGRHDIAEILLKVALSTKNQLITTSRRLLKKNYDLVYPMRGIKLQKEASAGCD